MRKQLVRHLACIRHIEYKRSLELDMLEPKDGNECTEGFIICEHCGYSYPVIGGIPILLPNISDYVSSRPYLLGRWILSSKSSALREYLKKISSAIKPSKAWPTDNYEVEGALYKSYNWAQFDFRENDRFLSSLKWKIDPNELYNKVIHSSITNLDGAALDLGCASGYAVLQLAKKFSFVIGLDLSYSFISEARRRMSIARQGNVEFVVADCLHAPFLHSKFDLVLAMNIIELVDVKQLLGIIHRLLREDGEVVFISPYDYNRNVLGERTDPQSFRQLIQKSGFKIGDRYKTETFLPWPLKISERTYLFYFVDYFRARKTSKSKG